MAAPYSTPGQKQTVGELPAASAFLTHQSFFLTADDGSGTIGSSDLVGVRLCDGSLWRLATLNNPISTPGNIQGTKFIATSEVLLVADDASSPVWTTTFFGFGANGSGNGVTTTIGGQTAFQTGSHDGGYLEIGGGTSSGTGIPGGVGLAIFPSGGGVWVGISVQEMANTARRVTALNVFDLSGPITTTEMPVNTGDGVTYWRTAVVDPTAPAVGGVIVYGSGGVLRIFPTSKVPEDIGSRGSISTGQGRPAETQRYVFQVTTSGAGNAGLVSVDLGPLGDGVYIFDFYVAINNVTDSAGAIIRCSGSWQNRGGTVTGVVFPWSTSTGAGLVDESVSQGAGGNGAKLSASIAGTLVAVDALPGAGNTGKTTDWAAWVEVRRMAFT